MEDWREETEERREEREISAWEREESWERSSGWRETTSVRSWESRRRMAWWRRSAVEAGDPEASTAEEKRGDGGAEGEERDLRVREELGVAGDDVVTELGVEEADRLVETLGSGGGRSGGECSEGEEVRGKEWRHGEFLGRDPEMTKKMMVVENDRK